MTLRRVTNRITPNLRRKASRLHTVARVGFKKFKDTTPIDTGNARRSTSYKERASSASIEANYPYANRLNEGYSRQAKNGMTEPTIKEMQKQARKIL